MEACSIDTILENRGAEPFDIMEVLQDMQASHGYLPEDVLRRVSTSFDVPLIEVFRLANFYKAFSLDPAGTSPADGLHGYRLPRPGSAQDSERGHRPVGHPARGDDRGPGLHARDRQLSGSLCSGARGRPRRSVPRPHGPGKAASPSRFGACGGSGGRRR